MTTSQKTAVPPRTSRQRSASGVATAVVLATAPAPGEGPAALLPWDGGTLLERLLEQLAGLGVADVHVVTRPGWRGLLDGVAAAVHVSPTPADDLRTIAEIAAGADGGVLVALGDVVAHREALANLLADPRLGTAVLTGALTPQRRSTPRVREQGGALASAGSPYHSVRNPTAAFLGVLQVAATDRAAMAALARQLAGLLDAGTPPSWETELERKRARALPDEVAALPQDVVSLLVTGLVRGGALVRSSRLRGLCWARPRSSQALSAAAERLAAVDEDRVHLDAAVKSHDGFFTTFFVSTYSRFIARWAARRGLTPNQVTTASALIGLLAAAAFALGDRWAMVAGAVLLQVSFTADCVDGQLARYTRNFSTYGAWLDAIFDRAKEYAVYAGLAIGAARAGDDVWLLAACALTLQTVRHMIFVGFRDSAATPARALPPIEQPTDRLGAGPAVEDPESPPPPRPDGRRTPPRLVRALWGRLDRLPGFVWARRMLEFPIGERFAAISLTAALLEPRVTFVVLLAWGGVAALYTSVVRAVRSLAGAPRHSRSLAILRDDGPLARWLGRAVGSGRPALGDVGSGGPMPARAPARTVPVGDLALVAGALVPLYAAIAIAGDGASNALAGAVVAWVVVCGGAASGARPSGRLRWMQLALLRLCEYGALLWLAALAGSSALPAATVLLLALAFRHYDVVYRVRLLSVTPGPALSILAGGWDGRLVAAYLLLLAGALPAAMYVAAGLLGAAFVADAIVSWTAHGRRAQRPPDHDGADED